ncbi:hypothetical protein RFI_35924 [Reticulomyxa filosa]|uniref:Uncharacterized protein n=1 Tax=Reticulomyxa filosa TaxID=46433 RepID=X6LJI1_RETFI|nr:hypothetical protein RFI_35924 [Reticulomyxa filosa]|eukprot:ETO01516.1 hypothetical protein RFI_35924 [Reticulomyxa filosa]
MSGILYNNIISNKDPSGSGLLFFWKWPPSKLFQFINHRLDVLEYLFISTEMTNIVMQYCKQGFRQSKENVCQSYADLLYRISMKLNERQLDDVV